MSKLSNRLIFIICISLGLFACEEGTPEPECDGSLAVSVASIVDASCGDNTGSINVTSSGANGDVMYSLDGGAAQGSATFADVAQGSYTVQVEDANGCKAEVTAEVKTGLVLADIQPIITTNCAISNCHNGDRTNLPNFATTSVLIANASGIKNRTGNETMPPAGRDALTASQIQMIACWVDDGAPQ